MPKGFQLPLGLEPMRLVTNVLIEKRIVWLCRLGIELRELVLRRCLC